MKSANNSGDTEVEGQDSSWWQRITRYLLENKLVVVLLLFLMSGAGIYVSPFSWDIGDLPRDPVAVDAIPDVGENQQIVFTKWDGRSPEEIDDQITYPLTTALLGIPGVKTVRGSSIFGASSIYVIFDDDVDFYWSRTRILEKLASLPSGTLPQEATPVLGPDATAVGQVFWYLLEGHDKHGNFVGGFDPHELRTIQDWDVRLALQSVPGVAEVASVGGHVREFQVEIDPDALEANKVDLWDVVEAVRQTNRGVGARTIEINRAEFMVRGLGLIMTPEDLEEAIVLQRDEVTPVQMNKIAKVTLGPALRRGALDDAGAEAVGGIVVARFGANPMEVVKAVKEKIKEIEPGLPSVHLMRGGESFVRIVPFYDRSELIEETLGTLSTALVQQVFVAMIVVLLLLRSLRSSLLIASVLPLSILATFVAMKLAGVEANIMALAGIAIAIGTMVDMGIVFTENIVSHLKRLKPGEDRSGAVVRAAAEVAPAVLTGVLTTVVSFLPVFALTSSEGKLFAPLAYTKSFAMLAALAISFLVLPAAAHLILRGPRSPRRLKRPAWLLKVSAIARRLVPWIVVAVVAVGLAHNWMPLGTDRGLLINGAFVVVCLAIPFGFFVGFQRAFVPVLRWSLKHRFAALSLPCVIVFVGLLSWIGFERTFSFAPESMRNSRPASAVAELFPGFGREFMPPFDEGQFLYMPTTMPHASMPQALEMLREMDKAIEGIPEVTRAVGKLGRAETALDPAPISMFETVVTYTPEYRTEPNGKRVRQWRDHIRNTDDIWAEIVEAASAPGLTTAPMLMPINTRIVMLQSGMRAPMGIKVFGPDLDTIEEFGFEIEKLLKELPMIRPETVFAERIVGKPVIDVDWDRTALAAHGLTIGEVQDTLQIAVGGKIVTRVAMERARHPVRVRLMREHRDSIQAIKALRLVKPDESTVTLGEVADVRYRAGPQAIRSEDTYVMSFVLFDRQPGLAEVDVVEAARALLQERIDGKTLRVPDGVSFKFAGSYENQLRSERRLMILIPVALTLVLLLLYLQFRSLVVSLMVYSGVLICLAGGFILMWIYGWEGFLDFNLFGENMAELFRVGTINLSVAVWVGFIALLGIATDTGVVMATYLTQRFKEDPPRTREEIHERAIEAATRRVLPCLMTTATTALALLPVITSNGRGADVMVPMALPSLGGMLTILFSLIVVPVLFAWRKEGALRKLQGSEECAS